MARSLGLQMVAEGIETAEQAEYLRARGVEYGQGWHFSKALCAADFVRFVEERNRLGTDPGPAGGRSGDRRMPTGRRAAKEEHK